LADQSAQHRAHGLLGRGGLTHLLDVEVVLQPGDVGVDAALATGLAQQRGETALAQCGAWLGVDAAARITRQLDDSSRCLPPRSNASTAAGKKVLSRARIRLVR